MSGGEDKLPENGRRSLTVVVPCYNEADNVPAVIPAIAEYCRKCGWCLIVVNDGSRDNTRALLDALSASHGFRVITHKLNRGYGGAIKSGIEAASTYWVVTVDADGQHNLDDVKNLWEEAERADADMVVGSRQGLPHASLYRGLGKFLIKGFARWAVPGNPIHDINSGMKLYRRDLAMNVLPSCPNGMAYSDVVLLMFVQNRCLVLERPITIQARAKGVSTISTMTAVETVGEITTIVVMFNPFRIFLPLAAIFFLLVSPGGGAARSSTASCPRRRAFSC